MYYYLINMTVLIIKICNSWDISFVIKCSLQFFISLHNTRHNIYTKNTAITFSATILSIPQFIIAV